MITWRYQYIEQGRNITAEEEINTTPDDHDRWMLVGYVKVDTKAMPGYEVFGKVIDIPVAYIHHIRNNQTDKIMVTKWGDAFRCQIPSIDDAGTGLGYRNYQDPTVRGLMTKIETSFSKFVTILNNIV